MFATASSVETVPISRSQFLGASSKTMKWERRDNGFRRSRIAQQWTNRKQAERARAISRAAEVGRRRTAIPFAGTRVLRRQATATQLRHRASDGEAKKRDGKRFPARFQRRQVRRT